MMDNMEKKETTPETTPLDTGKKRKKTIIIVVACLALVCTGVALALVLGGGEPPEEDYVLAGTEEETPGEEMSAIPPVQVASPPVIIIEEDFVRPVSPSELVPPVPHSTITAEAAHARMETDADFILLDVRTEEEFHEAHIPGAVLIPVGELAARAGAELPDQNIAIFIYCRTGNRSEQAAYILSALGFQAVYDFGGIEDWPFETVTE